MARPPGQAPAEAPQLPTVLMSVRVTVPPGSGDGDEALRLQLLMEPERAGEFRLTLRRSETKGGCSMNIAEFNLKDISYKVKNPKCHELNVLSQQDASMIFNFEDEREAQKWWTVVSSSLREVQKVTSNSMSHNHILCPVLGNPFRTAGYTKISASSSSGPGNPFRTLPTEGDTPAAFLGLSLKEDLALHLCKAVESGDQQMASQCATALAQQNVPLQILLKQSCFPQNEIRPDMMSREVRYLACAKIQDVMENLPRPIKPNDYYPMLLIHVGTINAASMKVGVEDASCSVNVTIKVQAYTTVAMLKQQVFQEYGFHPSVQRWIIGQCLCVDDRTLGSYGIRKDGDTAFLYLLSAKKANLSQLCYEEDQALAMMHPAPSVSLDSTASDDKWKSSTLPTKLSPKRDRAGHVLLVPSSINQQDQDVKCCSAARPQDYVIPGEYKPDETERWRLQQEKDGIQQYQQALEEERAQNFMHLLQLDDEVLVPNQEDIECRICFTEVLPGDGVLLRECLHSFCRECLRQVINCCEEPEVSCPFRDDSYACSSKLQEREIKALVSAEEYKKFLERGLTVAERQSENSYHCKTVDCRGWCIYEDSVNEFQCPICWKVNCLLCKAIHEGMNCRQYQDDLQVRAQNDAAARQTNDMLKTLVQMGEAMNCPKCQIIVQKKDGCDWIRCTVCQTEICWVTKGSRWGPAGPGDISGGCRCNVSGRRCHPQCQNCH